MPNSKQIVYLSQAQYAELIANGTITVDGVTVNYDENDIYVTPQAEPVTDVRVAGTSVAANGVVDIPIASGTPGVVKVSTNASFGVIIGNDGMLRSGVSSDAQIKTGAHANGVVSPAKQHIATFYGLAKAAGHDEKNSTESVGTYTPEAKGAIQQMLGVSDLIATAENNLVASKTYAVGDVFTANGKLYKATAAIAADEAIILQNEGEEIAGANAVESSIGEGFVKFTDYATATTPGIGTVNGYGIGIRNDNHSFTIVAANDNSIKNGNGWYSPIATINQHKATFYGLAKAAGVDEKNSTLPVGQYTDTAKSAIRSMIGASSTNVIAVQDTQPTDTDTKIWLPETAETPVQIPTMDDMNTALAGKIGDVQVNGTSIVSEGVATVPIASPGVFGLVKPTSTYGVNIIGSNFIGLVAATEAQIKAGSAIYATILPNNQYKATFYGLAKAAGDTTQAASNNAVGTYTDEAKAAIRTMLGAVGNEDYASTTDYGIMKISSAGGLKITDNGLAIKKAELSDCKSGTNAYTPIVPAQQQNSVFYALATAAGDTTQKSSSNAVGTYTDNAKASIKSMLGIVDGSTGTVDVTGTTPTITAVESTRYVCGEVTSLSFTPPASGISIVRFTSGSTVTVLTLPSTVKFPEWFDPTSLETNTIYEICITDGVYGAVMSWAL